MAPKRNPAYTGYALKQIYLIKEAMNRYSFVEAIKRCADVLAHIENEVEWCYNTDLTLPFMRAFFMELSELNLRLSHSTQKELKTQVTAAVQTLEKTIEELIAQNRDENLERTPEKPDALERHARCQNHRM